MDLLNSWNEKKRFGTKEKPFVVKLHGVHGCSRIDDLMVIPSNTKIIGTKNTSIFGDLCVENKTNISFECINFEPYLKGVHFASSQIELLDCSFKHSGACGLRCYVAPIFMGLTRFSWDCSQRVRQIIHEREGMTMVSRAECTVTATRCEFSANGASGVSVSRGSKGYFTNCTFHHNTLSGGVSGRTLIYSPIYRLIVYLKKAWFFRSGMYFWPPTYIIIFSLSKRY